MAKKDKKPKLPKSVGGVKLPKQLRKSASVVAEIAQNPIAREVVSAALAAGATALAKRQIKGAAGIGALSAPAKAQPDLANLIAHGSEIGDILSKGVTAFVNALTKPQAARSPAAEPTPSKASAKPAPRAKPAGQAKPAARAKSAGQAKPAASPRLTGRTKAGPKT